MKKYYNYVLAFFIPIMIMLIGMVFNKFYPFGDKILLMLDGYNQYPGFLNNFKETIFNFNSLFYSFRGLTGFNLYATSVYYTLNITNILFVFFKTSHIVDFYTLIIVIKLGLASLSMQTFLNYLGKKKHNYLFSICYALTTYNLLYYLNYMWFDSIIMLPLVILGIEKIFKDNKYYYYTITLTLSIIFNFYIGYMICIFSLLYFIYRWIIEKCPKDRLFKFIVYSLLSGLICAFTLIPVILELFNGKGLLFANTEYIKFDLDFINVFYKLTIGSFLNGDLEYGTPNVYVSIFVYINVLLYFFNKNVKTKEKVLSIILLAIFLLSMSFNLFDYFWQMLQMPIYYPVRYAFIFDFYLIYLAYKNYVTYESSNLIKIIVFFFIILVLSLIGFFTSGNLADKINIPAKVIYFGITILFLVYYLFILNNKDFKKYIYIVVLLELAVNTFVTLRNNGNINDVNTFRDSYSMNYNVLNKLELNSFNKVSFDKRTIKNNGLLLNYNDINYFSSIRNNKVFTLINKVLGILTLDDCNTDYYYNNPITNALLGIKYFVTKDNLNYYELIDNYDDYNIYKNNDITSIGFGVNSKIEDYTIQDNYLININNLIKVINNNDKNILREVEPFDKNIRCSSFTCITYGEEGYLKYDYTANKEEIIFLQNDFPTSKDKTKYEISINDSVFEFNTHYPIKINKNDNIKVTINPTEDFKDYFYHLYIVDATIYSDFIKNINDEKLEIIDYKNDANFKGKISMKEDGVLFTTISNDNGWKIYVDGKEENITPIMDGFMGVKLTKGEHIILFKYTPPGLKIGVIVSSVSLLIFAYLTYRDKKRAL